MSELIFCDDGNSRIYTIHSQKGGVGKTSIALALAGISCEIGKKTLIIDADMTGASLADIPGIVGTMEKQSQQPQSFNKLILAAPKKFEDVTSILKSRKPDNKPLEKHYCRKLGEHESGFFIFSSAKPEDVSAVVPLISQEDYLHFFRHRIEDVLAAAISDGFETIILDHSPGIFGFSKTSLELSLEWAMPQDETVHRLRTLLNATSKGKVSKLEMQAILVSSFEPHDYRALLPSFMYVLEGLGGSSNSARIRRKQWFINSFRLVFNRAPNVPDVLPEVNSIFDNLVGFSDELKQIIIEQEKEFGIRLAPYIAGFGMGDILSKAKAFVARKENEGTIGVEWQKWFETLAYRARLIKE